MTTGLTQRTVLVIIFVGGFISAAALQYARYKVDFPTVRDAVAANSMQIAEVKLLGAAFPENAFATDNAVAINGDVIPKGSYAEASVHDGDTLEIVRMVGGGAR